MTVPQFHVICGGLWQSHTEPWRVVEFTAGIIRTTPLSIPQRIIGVDSFMSPSRPRISGVTEVIIPNEGWNLIRPGNVQGQKLGKLTVLRSVSATQMTRCAAVSPELHVSEKFHQCIHFQFALVLPLQRGKMHQMFLSDTQSLVHRHESKICHEMGR